MTFISTLRGHSRVVGAGVAVAAAAIALAGCSSGGTTPSDSGKPAANYNIVVMPKSLGNKYFQASDAGAQAAIQAFGGTYSEQAANEASPTAQSPFIQSAIQSGAGAIVLAANDPQAVCSDLQSAQQAGIKVVTFDSDTNCRDLFINQVTVQAVADGLVKLITDHLGAAGGNVGIESGGPNATNLNAWVDAIKADLAQHPEIKLISDIAYGNDADQDSYNAAKGLITAHPEINAIIAPDSVAVKEAAHYIQDANLTGKIWLTGLGLPSELKDYVHAGVIEKFGLWNVGDLGSLAAQAAKALIDGTITGKTGDTFQATLSDGTPQTFTVGDKGEVDLGPLFVFDASNVDQFNF